MNASLSAALTVKEFLSWARISKSTFYKKVGAGEIPVRKIGKKSVVLRTDAENWLSNLPTV